MALPRSSISSCSNLFRLRVSNFILFSQGEFAVDRLRYWISINRPAPIAEDLLDKTQDQTRCIPDDLNHPDFQAKYQER